MRTLARVGVLFAAVLGMSSLFLLNGNAQNKKLEGDLDQIAADYAKGDAASAKKLAASVGKGLDDVEDLMHLLRPRKKKGLGVGAKAGEVTPDGIELMIQNLARDGISAGDLTKNSKALEQMAYRAAAAAEVALTKTPERDMGAKTKKLWTSSATESRDGSLALAKAIGSNAPAAVKAAATKVSAACTNCHNEFK